MAHICVRESCVMACRLFGAKPLLKPTMTYCQLDPNSPVPLAGDVTALARRTKKTQIRCRYATYAPGSSFPLWVRQTCAMESPMCAKYTPRAQRAPLNFEHAKKNRRAIAEPTLCSRCVVNAQCRRQRRRVCVGCTQPVRE